MTASRERGSAVIELPMAIGMLLIPVALLALMFAPWFGRRTMSELAAAEAAREIVTAPTNDPDDAAVRALVASIAVNHGIDPATVRAYLCVAEEMSEAAKAASSCDAIERGDLIRVEVAVDIPVVAIPLVGGGGGALEAGGFTWTAVHEEQVDLYRSLP